jgi:hypothetical protein
MRLVPGVGNRLHSQPIYANFSQKPSLSFFRITDKRIYIFSYLCLEYSQMERARLVVCNGIDTEVAKFPDFRNRKRTEAVEHFAGGRNTCLVKGKRPIQYSFSLDVEYGNVRTGFVHQYRVVF